MIQGFRTMFKQNLASLIRLITNPRKTLTDFVYRQIQYEKKESSLRGDKIPGVAYLSDLDNFANVPNLDNFVKVPNLDNFVKVSNLMSLLDARAITSSVNPIARVAGYWGYADSTASLTDEHKLAAFLNFQYLEKLYVSLSVASSFKGGDYVEFGSHDLYTLRNMLAAFDVGNLNARFPETQFYAFDIFGKFSDGDVNELPKYDENSKSYFKDFSHSGDLKEHYNNILEEFNVFENRTHLIQGLFEETLPKTQLTNKVGFAFLDCNLVPSYKYVLDWLFDKLQPYSFIYFDEYFDVDGVFSVIERFREKLKKERGLELVYVRPAASVGALFRVFEEPEKFLKRAGDKS